MPMSCFVLLFIHKYTSDSLSEICKSQPHSLIRSDEMAWNILTVVMTITVQNGRMSYFCQRPWGCGWSTRPALDWNQCYQCVIKQYLNVHWCRRLHSSGISHSQSITGRLPYLDKAGMRKHEWEGIFIILTYMLPHLQKLQILYWFCVHFYHTTLWCPSGVSLGPSLFLRHMLSLGLLLRIKSSNVCRVGNFWQDDACWTSANLVQPIHTYPHLIYVKQSLDNSSVASFQLWKLVGFQSTWQPSETDKDGGIAQSVRLKNSAYCSMMPLTLALQK